MSRRIKDEMVETAGTMPRKKGLLGVEVLDTKTKCIKFKEAVIIIRKTTNGKQRFIGIGNNENIIQLKTFATGGEIGRPNVR